MSRTRAGVEIGFGSCEETVSSWVLVQKSESPMLVISVPAAWRSKRKISRLATRSMASVATKRKMTLLRSRSWVGVTPRATITNSAGPGLDGLLHGRVFPTARSRLSQSFGRRSSASGSPASSLAPPGGQAPNQLSRAPSIVITQPERKSPAGEAR